MEQVPGRPIASGRAAEVFDLGDGTVLRRYRGDKDTAEEARVMRWRHESNRGFLRALEGLRSAAAEIGEVDEEERCRHFLHQCDPEWPPPAE